MFTLEGFHCSYIVESVCYDGCFLVPQGCVGSHGGDGETALLPGPPDGQQAAGDASGRGRLRKDGAGERQALKLAGGVPGDHHPLQPLHHLPHAAGGHGEAAGEEGR